MYIKAISPLFVLACFLRLPILFIWFNLNDVRVHLNLAALFVQSQSNTTKFSSTLFGTAGSKELFVEEYYMCYLINFCC